MPWRTAQSCTFERGADADGVDVAAQDGIHPD